MITVWKFLELWSCLNGCQILYELLNYILTRLSLNKELFKCLYVDNSAPLLIIHDYGNKEQLILSLGRDINILYGIDSDEKTSISFGVDISDNEWHRLGISIKGDSVTIILDCYRHITKKLRRNQKKMTTGIVMIRQHISGALYLVSNNIK